MAYGKGDRLPETRDGNLSSILSRVRDYGPAGLGPAPAGPAPVPDSAGLGLAPPGPAPAGPARVPDSTGLGLAPPGSAPAGPALMPDIESAEGGTDTALQLLREAEPPEASRAEMPAPPRPPGPEAMPNPSPEPAARAMWRAASLPALAILTAILVTGGVIAALYRAPTETASPKEGASSGDLALREEIAAIQTSIAMLAERVEAIGAADKVHRQGLVAGERLDPAAGQIADPGREGRGAEGQDVRLDKLAQRLDSMAEQVMRLTSETERPQTRVQADPARPGPHRMGRSIANTDPAAADAVARGGAASGKPRAVSGAASDAEDAPLRIAPDRAAETVGPVHPGPLAEIAYPIGAAGPPVESAAPRQATKLSPKATTPIAGTSPLPRAAGESAMPEDQATAVKLGAPVVAVDPVGGSGARRGIPLVGPVDDAAPPSLTPVSPVPETEQGNAQRLAFVLEQEIAIGANLVKASGVREGKPAAEPEATEPRAPSMESVREWFAKIDLPAVPEVPGVEAVAAPEAAALEATGPKVPSDISGEEWFINLVAVRSEPAALDLQQTYRDKGVDAQVVPLGRSGKFGVRVGGFGSRRDAIDRVPAIKAALGIKDVWIGQR